MTRWHAVDFLTLSINVPLLGVATADIGACLLYLHVSQHGARGGQYLLSIAGERFGLNRSPGSSSVAKKTRIYRRQAPPLIAGC